MTFRKHGDRPSRVWQYSRRADGIEQAIWSGSFSLPLSCHFHPEIQITVVRRGRRRFLTPDGSVAVAAGETFLVPPGLPHQPLGIDTDPTLSLNLYLRRPAGVVLPAHAIVVPTPHWFSSLLAAGISSEGPETEKPALTDWTIDTLMRSDANRATRASEAIAAVLSDKRLSIGELASTHGMSRGGFIRWFHRNVGMTPHAYRLACRLNSARALLATNATPAQAAAETGFADQSHMGRNFRLAFGATPGGYRCAVRG